MGRTLLIASLKGNNARLSRRFLYANWVALRDAFTVPIRAKACRRGYKSRKSNVGEEQKTEHRQDEQRA